MKNILRFLPLMLVFVFGLFWIWFSRVSPLQQAEQGIVAPRAGFLAPNYLGELSDGTTLTAADIKGVPVVLNIWASWCPPCRAEMPTLQKMSQRYELAGVKIIGVNSTSQDSTQNALSFLRQNNISFPIVMDKDGSIISGYQINSLPTTFFIAANGKIVNAIIGGPISEASMIGNIERMLEEQP